MARRWRWALWLAFCGSIFGLRSPGRAQPSARDVASDDKATLRSLLAESLTACDPRQLAALDEPLEKLQRAHPDDLSVAITSALRALASGETGRIGPALERLDRLVARTPLEPLPPGVRANARQRAEAARPVPLWLVAHACDNSPETAHRPIADRLAARALEAARRQAHNTVLMAMLREQGERALARGDRKGAEAICSRMLETAVAPPRPVQRRPAPGTRNPGAPSRPQPSRERQRAVGQAPRHRSLTVAAPYVRRPLRLISYQDASATQPATQKARATPKARTKAAPSANLPILTLDRFEQAMQIAKLAAERDLPELSFRAVRESLQAGPPIVPTNATAEARALRMAQRGIDEGTADPVAPRVIANLVALEQAWQEHHAPPASVYEVLRGAVLPAGRPAEVFLYAPPLNARALWRTRSAGAMLAAWAVRAGKVDDLRRAIEGRKGQPLSELPSAVLTAQLALAADDDASAIAALKTLAERLKRDTLRSTAELACHAALPALGRPRPEVARAAVDVLDGCAKGFESGWQPEPVGTLLVLLARRQWQLGDVAGARKRLDAYMEAMEKNASRYSGDYSLFIRKQHLERVASEYARAGLWAEALTALGRYADSPVYSGGDPPVTGALARLLQRLAAAPARERYETLHDWTMPAKDRRVVRILAAQGVRDLAPAVFTKTGSGAGAAMPDENTLLSTSTALIDAARQIGALDKLADEARAAADQKIENAEALLVLIELARGQGAKVAGRLEARVAEQVKQNQEQAREKSKPETQNVAPRFAERLVPKFPWNDYLMARAALGADDPAIVTLGHQLVAALIEHAEKKNNYAVLAGLRGDLAAAAARRAGAPQALTASFPSAWRPADVRPGYDLAANGAPAYWAAHQGYVAHPSGSTADLLVFDYPLGGSYEVSVDAYAGPWAGSVVVHGGLCVLPSLIDGNAEVFPVGQGETIPIPWRLSRPESFNRVTIQVAPGKVRYLVNGHLLYEDDDPSPISPWLALLTSRERSSAWRNLSLKGNPTIPREVKLSQGDRLEGWVSSFYRETQPSRRTDQVTDRWGNVATAPGAQRRRPRGPSRSKKPRATVNVDDYDWAAKDGVIHGRRVPYDATVVDYYDPDSIGTVTEADQSRLYYHRPLGDGDVITYEFLYEPGQVMVHPALDRVAFLLEPDGVKAHWMTAGGNDISGLPADNAIDEPANRRGPRLLPLKPGRWNAVRLALSGDRIAIELNGQAIYERAMEPALGRQFGLFHYKDQTSAQARNIVLTGKWPDALPDQLRADLAAMSPSEKPSDPMRRARHAIVGERLFALEAGSIVEKARALGPEARYTLLADWVLPGPDHPIVRLAGDFAPSYPAPPDAGPGGTLRAPAVELVAAAREVGKLGELAGRIEKMKAEGDDPGALAERGRMALLSLVQSARGDDATAGRSLGALRTIVEKQPLDLDTWARWPELVAADQAVLRPALRKPALALAEVLAGRAEKRPITEADNRVPSTLWEAHVKNLRARAALPSGAVGDPIIPHWKPATQTTARSRGEGHPIPRWSSRDGALTHQLGHADDMIYLSAPLRGSFELACELTAPAGREIRFVYGGQVLGLKSDGKHLERSQVGRAMPDVAITPPIEKPGDSYALRLAVDGNRMSVSINGRKVHESLLPVECDPWLAFLSTATQSGAARKIAITGHPRIPDRLNLSGLPDLAGWRTDEYGETTTGDDADWEKRGEEIVGRLIEDIPGARQESVLRYHRPMFEDGRIDYEFYYDPGKALVHPALDRLAFLLEPDGVRVHRLTDGAYERSGLSPDNVRDEPENRRGPASLPLKSKSWNQMAVAIKGDKVTLELNGQAIFERTLEPANRRAFGLFHDADATQARVRNVIYQGDWPRSLPAGIGR